MNQRGRTDVVAVNAKYSIPVIKVLWDVKEQKLSVAPIINNLNEQAAEKNSGVSMSYHWTLLEKSLTDKFFQQACDCGVTTRNN